MNVSWLDKQNSTTSFTEDLIQLEFDFRQKITRFILLEMDKNGWDGLDDMHFDFCTDQKTFSLSLKTPEPYFSYFSKVLSL
ncbi:hypothetical protein [Aquimarina brevivitae]|nr:hypothetical protein [Aquimarina brevivitae]